MSGEREFYVHTFTVKVLSDGMFFYTPDLNELHHEVTYGACVLHSMDSTCEAVSEVEMAGLLVDAGSEPEFFQIDEDPDAIFIDALSGVTYVRARPEGEDN
jgi:hypothetical protein